ncbi:hypothetical protein [Streptomyces sp. NPDC046939]|uniref:hypothetical protein n=1 Tax=Streptomyces sp. NPDC046939 TaxID=3155376 RepID=UPI0033DF4E0D
MSRKTPRKISKEVVQARGRVAAAARWNGDVTEAKRELKTVVLADYIRKIVDTAPELNEEQRIRLATLLRPVTKGGAHDGR